jgi:hypothetical protein
MPIAAVPDVYQRPSRSPFPPLNTLGVRQVFFRTGCRSVFPGFELPYMLIRPWVDFYPLWVSCFLCCLLRLRHGNPLNEDTKSRAAVFPFSSSAL